jgi:hypothetical protein
MFLRSLGSRNRKAPLCRESGPEGGLAENIDVSEFHLQREALIHRGKGNDYAALMAELLHDALYSLKSATAHAHRRSKGYIPVGP